MNLGDLLSTTKYACYFDHGWFVLSPAEELPDVKLLCRDFIESHIVFLANSKLISLNHKEYEIKNNFIIYNGLQIEILEMNYNYIIDQPVFELQIDNNIELLLSGIDSNIIKKIEERIALFNNFASELQLNEIAEDVEKLLADCHLLLSRLNEQVVAKTIQQYRISWDQLFLMIEKFVLENVYEIVYFKTCFVNKQKDFLLMDILQNCQDAYFELSVYADLNKAAEELKKIEGMRAPMDKINCILKMMNILNDTCFNPNTLQASVISGDDLLPMIIICIIRSNVLNLESNLDYIKRFSFEKQIDQGQIGYSLSTFEAALGYIESNSESLQHSSKLQTEFLDLLIAGDTEKVARYIQSMENKNRLLCCDTDGNNALAICCEVGVPSLVEYFVTSHKSLLAARNFVGQTALHIVANTQNIECLQILLRNGAKNLKDKNGYLPVETAIINSCISSTKVLFEHGARFSRKYPLLHLISSVESLNFLLENDFPINNTFHGKTPLIHYCEKGMKDLAISVMNYGTVNLEIRDYRMKTFLHYCGDHPEILKFFFQKFQPTNFENIINSRDILHNTPLHYAASIGNLETVEILLKHGANPSVINSRNIAPDQTTVNEQVREHISDSALFFCPTENEIQFTFTNFRIYEGELFMDLKSASKNDPKDITTVSRTLQDFAFLHSQLLIEYPEACLPEFREFTANSKWSVEAGHKSKGPRVLQLISTRLGIFLEYLLGHPKFATHELLLEFLHVSEIERDMVLARIHSKVEYLEDTIRNSQPTVVENINQVQKNWNEITKKLEKLQVQERFCGSYFSKMQMAQKGFAKELLYYSMIINFPVVGFAKKLPGLANFLIKFSEISNETCKDQHSIARYFSDLAQEITGTKEGITYFERLCNEYQSLLQHSTHLSSDIERMSELASNPKTLSQNLVANLNQSYILFSQLTDKVETRACKLNFLIESLEVEYQYFAKFHQEKTEKALDEYVENQIKNCTNTLALFDRFSIVKN
ncbi:hypothetical protein HDV06_001613 [Boothiomyces sp. JEL0866]|nr:hypothetical protein HDV06_001613 [Boothiomyces sp. JEL0866]